MEVIGDCIVEDVLEVGLRVVEFGLLCSKEECVRELVVKLKRSVRAVLLW